MIGEQSIEVYISAPDQLGEFDSIPVTKEYLIEKFQDKRISSLDINLFKYDASPFIAKVKQLGLPDIIPSSRYYPYRIISLIHAINRLALQMIQKSNADRYIMTRIDMLPHISRIGTLHTIVTSDEVYGWRSCPCEQEGVIEDRFIVCGRNPVTSLTKYAEEFPHLYQDRFLNEYILGEYLSKRHIIKKQFNVSFTNPALTSEKYTDNFRTKVNNIINCTSH